MVQQILSNLRSYFEGGLLLAVIGLMLTLKLKNIKIGKLTVDKILADSKAQQAAIDAQLKAQEDEAARLKKEYENAISGVDFTNNSH